MTVSDEQLKEAQRVIAAKLQPSAAALFDALIAEVRASRARESEAWTGAAEREEWRHKRAVEQNRRTVTAEAERDRLQQRINKALFVVKAAEESADGNTAVDQIIHRVMPIVRAALKG